MISVRGFLTCVLRTYLEARASALAALHFDHAYFSNVLVCFHEWRTTSLPGSTVLRICGRVAEEKWAKEGEGPKKPQCQMDTYEEALRSTSTLREMLRDRTASANYAIRTQR